MAGSSKTKPKKGAPISTHPAFPAIVALWFAALFGLGSLAVPIVLFETLATATGLSSVVAAAAPPLGITARIIIALVAVGIGVMLGLWLARKVVNSHKLDTARDRRLAQATGSREAAPAAKKPILAHEELGEEGLDGDVEDHPGDRRRSLAVTEESGPSELFAEANLPGGSAFELMDEIRERDGIDAPESEADEVAELDEANSALELTSLADLSEPSLGDDAAADMADTPEPASFGELPAEEPRQVFGEPAEANVEAAQVFGEPQSEAEPVEAAPFSIPQASADNESPHAAPDGELFERSPFANPADSDSSQGSEAMETTPSDEPFSAPFSVPSQADAVVPPFGADTVEPATEAPSESKLDDLSIAQLVERFSSALRDRSGDKTETEVPVDEEIDEQEQVVTAEAAVTAPADQPEAIAVPEQASESEPTPAPFSLPQETFAPAAVATPTPSVSFSMPEPVPANEPAPVPASVAASDAPAIPAALRPAFAEPQADVPAEDAPAEEVAQPANPAPVQAAAPAIPAPFAPLPTDDDDADMDEGEVAYSSLLSMKTRLTGERDAVRIEDEVSQDAEEGDPVEPVVVFPGSDQRRASPATDGPSRSPVDSGGASAAPFTGPAGQAAASQGNAGETEQALRDALEKLQRLGRTA